MNSIHQFSFETIDGGEIDFARYKGKKIIVVNVASECGYTPQYQQLQELYENFLDHSVIVGFPMNNFGGQEPNDNSGILSFCQKRYGVSFPLAAKSDLYANPIYQWLTDAGRNGVMDSEVRWNFQKYLLDEAGQLQQVLPSAVEPFDDQILNWLQKS